MQPSLIVKTVLVTTAVFVFTTIAEAGQFGGRNMQGNRFAGAEDSQERITLEQRLEDAGVPLSATQLADIEKLEKGPGYRASVQSILEADQIEALKAAREEFAGEMKGRRGRGRGGRIGGGRMMGAILKKAGQPLSESQIAELKAIERGPEAHEAVMTILSDKQKAALEEARAAGIGTRGGRIGGGRMMGAILKKAGQPLSKSQIAELKAIERGPEAHEAVIAILNDEQTAALEEARAKMGEGRRGRRAGGRFFECLDVAGCPLTDEQKALMKELPRGPERREAMRAILTDEQVAALSSARGVSDESLDGAVGKTTAVEKQPGAFNLFKQNYPNPFNPTTTIDFQLAQSGNARVEVYSPGGQLVATLVNEYKSAGTHSVVWDASNQAAGIYICKIVSGDFSGTQKMTLVK